MHRKVILTLTERLTLLVQGGNLLLVQEGNSYSVRSLYIYMTDTFT